jgi:hypothetical protein
LLFDEVRMSFMEDPMHPVRTLRVLSLIVLFMAPAFVFAQQPHIVAPDQLTATVAGAAAKQDQDRATVREALTRPQVQEVASKLGLDLSRATAAVDTLAGADLEKAADAAQQVNDQLVGGASTVVISTTTIIIILLLVIILIIAVK